MTSRAHAENPADAVAGVVTAPLVLVIDDDRDACLVWSECLSHLGYRVMAESTGEDGVRTAWRQRPTAILMDLTLPGIGGIEATRRIKADTNTRDCLIIAVSARDPSVFPQVREAGCDAYFCKPFDAFALHGILRILRGGPRPARSGMTGRRCACGRAHTREAWLALRFCGAMHLPNTGERLEVRDCFCGSPVVMPAPMMT
jgi:two-component system cell cycle response regulator DivK